ncbi:hypothetical protein PR002_g11620 [Phytophthora rubi]|uniref:Thioredoxin domain-containing protein n=1 Tax=Phytophthora rubi TaxID=129364 RepID=A0A6A3M1N9_9STRA|nr:hypothetical protein PR002_g11620 [Phytophthora rubi]
MSQGCWGWFLRNVLRQDDERIPDNSRVIRVRSEQQFKELLGTSKRSVVVNFSAAWCGPCRYMSPAFHELSAKYPATVFLKVDVDELKAVARSCGVTTMPTFQFFRGGAKCDEVRGADSHRLEARIQKHDDGKSVDAEDLRQRKPRVVTVTSQDQWEQLLQQNQESNKATVSVGHSSGVRSVPDTYACTVLDIMSGALRVLVVDFWATWCKPCLEIAPFFEELSGRFPAAVFARVDVDELDTVTEEFNVSSLPSFKVFKGGKVVDELSGAIKTALESMVAKHATD